MEAQYFKAKADSNRYKKGQKVWISLNCANHLWTYHKWRGSGRYVKGSIDKFSPLVGDIKTIDVSDKFGKRINRIRPTGGITIDRGDQKAEVRCRRITLIWIVILFTLLVIFN